MASTTFEAAAAAPDAERIDPRRLLAFLAMCFGMFMAFLDIQIVSASLTEIQAGLAASQDEITWVQTSYLMAEVVAIPLSGFLSRVLGTRIMFAASAAGFTVASLMCGLSSSMSEMIVWRAIQGFLGGGMVPTVFASAYLIFPRSRMPMIVPMIGLVATLAPTIGPTVGGYLTELMSWHWLFFINIVPGIVVTLATFALIDFDRPNFALFDKFDWWGLIFMAAIPRHARIRAGGRPAQRLVRRSDGLRFAPSSRWCRRSHFFARVLTAREPIVDLKAFADRNFAIGSMFSFVLGIGLYGLTYLFPLYLGQIRGYNALMVGETMFVSGVAMFVSAPIVGQLMTPARSAHHADERILHLRARLLADDVADQGLGFLGAVRAADFPRRRHDAGDRADYQRGARHAVAGAAQECLGPVQSHAQSGRSGRARGPKHAAQQPHRPSSCAPARRDQLVARPGGRDAEQSHRAIFRVSAAMRRRWR